MYRVDAVQDGDLQTRFTGRLLDRRDELVPLLDRQREILDVQDRADAVLDDRFAQLRRVDPQIGVFAVGDHADLELRHLSDLFLERHAADEIADATNHVVARRRQGARVRVEKRLAVDDRAGADFALADRGVDVQSDDAVTQYHHRERCEHTCQHKKKSGLRVRPHSPPKMCDRQPIRTAA